MDVFQESGLDIGLAGMRIDEAQSDGLGSDPCGPGPGSGRQRPGKSGGRHARSSGGPWGSGSRRRRYHSFGNRLNQNVGQLVRQGVLQMVNPQVVNGAAHGGVDPLDQAANLVHVRRRRLHENRVGAVIVSDFDLVHRVGLIRVARCIEILDERRHPRGGSFLESERRGLALERRWDVEALDFLQDIFEPDRGSGNQDGILPGHRQQDDRGRVLRRLSLQPA